jgi:tRNA(fMet)-specific endonuclease VapC
VSLYLVDTDWVIDSLHGHESARQTLLDLAPHGLPVSLIPYGELYEGAYYARHPQAALEALRDFLEGKELLPLTTAIMERFAILRGQLLQPIRRQVGDMDLLIAATALTHDLLLLTRNIRDYRHVPGLKHHQSGH